MSSAFRAFCEEHSKAMRSLDQEIKDGRKTLKVTERAISARNKKVAAVRKRVAQRNKVCHEWQAKIKAMQDEMAKVVAFKERIDVEVQSGQFMLEEEQRRGDQIQQQSAAHEREVMELRSSCAALESEIQDTQNDLCKPMQSKLAMAEIAVTNHVNEIRDNFLSSFAVDAADGLIEQISKEIDGWVRNSTDEVNKSVARQTLELNEKYKGLAADTRKDYDKIMKQKGALYDALVKKLKKKTEKRATPTPPLTSKKNEMTPLRLAMDHTYELKEARMSEDSKSENNPEVHKYNEKLILRFLPNVFAANCLTKPNLTRTVSNQVKSAVRRQLAPRMNLMDESFQSHKEIPEIASTRQETSPREVKPARISLPQHTKGAREPRLKRRKRAQKTGKTIAAHVTPEGTLSIIDNYENPACTSTSKVSSKDPLESPVGCDDELAVTKEATRNRSIQRASKVSIHQEEYPTNKGSGKRSKNTTRFRRNKPTRVSLGRSLPAIHAVDWSAADTFSFD
ncbi:hypothetical protein CCR75_007714 [Bremia lactucae]|uniref:Uncharacterized protein n=1 Tax=Bremia lactucae TaxID=4779 RepID=A0A976IF06_BRELC|nr:hypothetical protein CCR75_007714 [Bremia lactucae]